LGSVTFLLEVSDTDPMKFHWSW